MLRGSAGGRGDPRGLGGRDHSDSIQDCSSCCGFYLFSFFVLFRFECLFIVNNLIFNFLKKNGQVGWLPVSLVLQWNQHVFIYLFIYLSTLWWSLWFFVYRPMTKLQLALVCLIFSAVARSAFILVTSHQSAIRVPSELPSELEI